MKCILLIPLLLLAACSQNIKKAGYVDYIIYKESDGSTTAYMTEEFKNLANFNRPGEPAYVKLSDDYIETSIPAYPHIKPITIPAQSLVKIQWKE